MKTKAQISCAVTAQLIIAFVFTTQIVHFLFFLNLIYQASSIFLRLYRAVCVRLGRIPLRPVFSRQGSYELNIRKRHSVQTQRCIAACASTQKLRRNFHLVYQISNLMSGIAWLSGQVLLHNLKPERWAFLWVLI